MNRFARAALDILRVTFTRERLGPAPAAAPAAEPRANRLLRAVFAFEPLPEDPVPERRARLRSVLSWIFAFEPLPQDPVPPRAARRGWFATLFGFEKLDPPP